MSGSFFSTNNYEWNQGGEKYQEAFYIYEEFGQSNTAQTVKVLNGQAAANLALGRYPEAESLLLEAQNKVKKKGSRRDKRVG